MAHELKPRPVKDALTAPFWEACARGELLLQFCPNCERFQHYPRPICVRCGSLSWTWRRASGQGKIYSFTVVRQNGMPGFREETPYILAQVELVEGVRMTTNVVDCAPETARIGLEVEVVFERLAEDLAVPKFRPLSTSQQIPPLNPAV